MPQKPQKKETLPVKVDVDLQNGGTITYANEVIATIAGVATNEIDGVAGMCVSGGFSEILSRNRNITRGVKVEVGSQEAAVDLYIIVEYGTPIQKVAAEVQENVRKALESLTGLHVVRVDVHVQGVSFEKEKKAAQSSIEAAKSPVLAEPEKEIEPAEDQAAADDAPAEEPDESPDGAAQPDGPLPDDPLDDGAQAVQEVAVAEPAEEPAAEAPVTEESAAQDAEAVSCPETPEVIAAEAEAPAPADEPAAAAPEPATKPAPRRRRKKAEEAAEAPDKDSAKPAKGPGGRKRA